MKLVIDREKWLRGEGEHVSRLLREHDGKMCCLGFFGLACGLSREEMSEVESPDLVEADIEAATNAPHKAWTRLNQVSEFLFDKSSEASGDCNSLMLINDDAELPDAERERQIFDIFAFNGVEVEFIGPQRTHSQKKETDE